MGDDKNKKKNDGVRPRIFTLSINNRDNIAISSEEKRKPANNKKG